MTSPRGSEGDRRGMGVLWALFTYEMRMLLRDRRTILIAVVAPLVLFPALLFAMRAVQRAETRRLEEATYEYVVGGTSTELASAWVDSALIRGSSGTEGVTYRFREREHPDPESLLESGEIQVVVRWLTPEQFRLLQEAEAEEEGLDEDEEETAEEEPEAAPDPDAELPVLRLLYRGDSNLSRSAAARMGELLTAYRTERQERLYRERGLVVDPARIANVTAENVASAEREGGALLGLLLTPVLLLLMISGGSIVAADAIAGEKERGTLETLLTTAVTRAEIVDAKMLSVVAVGVAVAFVNVLNLLLYLVIGVAELPEGFAVRLSPLSLVVVPALFLPLTVLIAGVLLLLSGYARSYKEYQVYFLPVFLLLLLPSLAATLPGMELRSLIAIVPISNVGVAVREVMVGRYDWPFLLIVMVSTAAAASAVARLTGRTLSTERLISQSDLDEADLVGGPALFQRHVLAWFGVMWAVLLVVSLWFGERLGIRGQVAVNILGIFLGGTVLMIRRYRLPVREALALRPVKAPVWLAVLVGAPSALLVGNGIAQLAQHVLPVPEEVMEAFGQFLLPEALPLWQVILLMAVLPGICEEVAFRGVLLYGLRRALRPVPLALVAGLLFGLFHVALFRILPTAYMGVLLTAVTLLTGSIFPAMVWHMLNNASALVPAYLGWVPADLSVDPWMYGVAVAGLATAFWILWRERTPYPGLKRRPPRDLGAGRTSARR